jgi:hypothetical protein
MHKLRLVYQYALISIINVSIEEINIHHLLPKCWHSKSSQLSFKWYCIQRQIQNARL